MIGLAHGSRHPAVQASMNAVMAAVAAPDLIARTAFLDLCEPDLATVVADLGVHGHRAAVVIPLLFTAAFHARVDVPEAVGAAAESGFALTLGDILGTDDTMLEVLIRQAADEAIPDDDAVLLFAVGSSSAEANGAIHSLADRWSRTRGGPVRAAFGTADPRATSVLAGFPATVMVPLFVSPGLLLDVAARTAAEHGIRVLPPLGTRLAPIIRQRYASALAGARMSNATGIRR